MQDDDDDDDYEWCITYWVGEAHQVLEVTFPVSLYTTRHQLTVDHLILHSPAVISPPMSAPCCIINKFWF